MICVVRRTHAAAIAILMILSLLFTASGCTSGNGGAGMEEIIYNKTEAGQKLSGAFSIQIQSTEGTLEAGLHTVACSFSGKLDISATADGYALTLTELQISIKAGDASVEYDSANHYSDEAAALRILPYEALMGVTYEIQINEEGKVVSLSGYSKVLDYIAQRARPYGETALAQAQYAATEYFGEGNLAYLAEKLLGSVPYQTIAAGRSWSHSSGILEPYQYVVTEQTVYEGIQNQHYQFTQSGTLSSDESAAQEPFQYTLSGTAEGSISLDCANPLLRTVRYSENINGTYLGSTANAAAGRPISIQKQLTGSITQHTDGAS